MTTAAPCPACDAAECTLPDPAGSADAAGHAGISFRQLDHWGRAGYIRPLPREAATPGRDRLWPRAEVEVARRMARLTAAGLTPSAAARFARDGWPFGVLGPGVGLYVIDALGVPEPPAAPP